MAEDLRRPFKDSNPVIKFLLDPSDEVYDALNKHHKEKQEKKDKKKKDNAARANGGVDKSK